MLVESFNSPNLKKFVKSKGGKIAIAGTAVLGLYVAFNKKNSEEIEVKDGVVPSYYDGYPSIPDTTSTGGALPDTSQTDAMIDALGAMTGALQASISAGNEQLAGTLQDQYSALQQQIADKNTDSDSYYPGGYDYPNGGGYFGGMGMMMGQDLPYIQAMPAQDEAVSVDASYAIDGISQVLQKDTAQISATLLASQPSAFPVLGTTAVGLGVMSAMKDIKPTTTSEKTNVQPQAKKTSTVTGGSGKNYNVASNGTITVKNGSKVTTYSPGQKGYSNANKAMQSDTGRSYEQIKATTSGSSSSRSSSSSSSKPATIKGGSGKSYSVSSSGTITVKNGSKVTTYSPGQKGYANANKAMQSDTGKSYQQIKNSTSSSRSSSSSSRSSRSSSRSSSSSSRSSHSWHSVLSSIFRR